MENNVFEELNKINVNEHIEKKNTGSKSLSYLSWCWAWAETKKRFPAASYEIVKFENGLPYCYDPKTGYMVYTKVTINDITHEMWLPVMDNHNAAMLSEPYEVKTKYSSYTVEKCTMFDINKTIMRCLVKNLAMFGLGLYIYAGEDLPEDSSDERALPEGSKTEPVKEKVSPEELAKLKVILQDWVCSGAIPESWQSKVDYYLANDDVEGIRNVIKWCKENKDN